MDSPAGRILTRFEDRVEQIADEIADATVAEVEAFGAMRDATLRAEVRALARQHLSAFLQVTRAERPPPAQMLADVRERAATRARQLVPLAALVHSYMIAQRVISAAITREAGPDARSRGAALELMASTFEYNIAVTTAMADAYVETVQGDLAELDSARRAVVDAMLRADADDPPELARRAVGLGLDLDRAHVVVLVAIGPAADGAAPAVSERSAVQSIARASGRPERQAFVVGRGDEVVAVLDTVGPSAAKQVLDRAAAQLAYGGQMPLRAGVGTPFVGVGGFRDSYHQARRALRHATPRRPVIVAPADVLLFDELTTARSDDAGELIPRATREALADPVLRTTLQAWVDADLNVATAARVLSLHPNSMRYRLRRITELTGRDPRSMTDLLELIAASRLMSGRAGA
jgi:hypothetical protein